jgi:adenylate kinase family enzyme
VNGHLKMVNEKPKEIDNPKRNQQVGQRISVVGTSGSGKTTTAQEISKRLRIPHIELDALSWAENWTATPEEEFQAGVRDAVAGERWVIDGNYSRIRSIVWVRAETVVYLKY